MTDGIFKFHTLWDNITIIEEIVRYYGYHDHYIFIHVSFFTVYGLDVIIGYG